MKSEPDLRAVLWDMGGVLLRNMIPEPRIRLAELYGMSESQLEELVFENPVSKKATIGEVGVEELWEYVREALQLDPQKLAEFEVTFWSSDRVDEELIDFIQSLRQNYKIGLLSNAFVDARPSLSKRFPGLLNVFDEVVFSYEVKIAKPDPRIYSLMLDKLGLEPENAIFVDDFRENVEAAHALGIHAIQFRNSRQARQAVLEVLSSNGAE
jgi:haloacid dehalogenase superfamily, subfamily IA, variant 3 with third motif having DD or ED/haloacid dehalogenase superfamily, subfamily IA, variant 1 with third motif having Dx(3-4)D or Dx(3-4)E